MKKKIKIALAVVIGIIIMIKIISVGMFLLFYHIELDIATHEAIKYEKISHEEFVEYFSSKEWIYARNPNNKDYPIISVSITGFVKKTYENKSYEILVPKSFSDYNKNIKFLKNKNEEIIENSKGLIDTF